VLYSISNLPLISQSGTYDQASRNQQPAANNSGSEAMTKPAVPAGINDTDKIQSPPGDNNPDATPFTPPPVQRKNTTLNNADPIQQFKPAEQNHSGLPANLRSGMESLSGFSMKDVKVNYNSDKPAQLNAHAYAQGSQIEVAPGQEKHLPHEAWHVVQQKQGRVKPTLQMKTNAGAGAGTVQREDKDKEEKNDDVVRNFADDSPYMPPAEEKNADPVLADVKAPADEKRDPRIHPEPGPPEAKEAFAESPDAKRREKSRHQAHFETRDNKTVGGWGQGYKSGFVKAMKKKMVDIVKDVQQKHGQMEQADNYIHGDANVNLYFSQESERAEKGDKSESDIWDVKDAKPERFKKLGAAAGGVLEGAFKSKIIPGGLINDGKLKEAVADSTLNKAASKNRLERTSADKVIVEMYYNELDDLHKKNDEKNSTKSVLSVLDSNQKLRAIEESKLQERKDAEALFTYGFIRQQDVKARHTEQKALRGKLEAEGRITTTARRAREATYVAILNVLVKTVTLGVVGVKKNRDKRGVVKGFDFTADEQTGQVSRQNLGGSVEFTTLKDEYRFARDELKAKWAKRAPLGKYSGASLVFEGFKKFIDVIQSIFSSAALFLTGAGLIPGLAPIMAPLVAFCSSVALAIGVAKAALSLVITAVNALAQLQNNNPELFAEMSGETSKSLLNTATDSAGIGVAALWGSGNLQGGGSGIGDRLNFRAPAYQAGPGMGSSDWFKMQGNMTGAAVTSTLVPKVTNAAVSATGDLDNNDMTYSQTVNPERRIGKQKHKAKSDYVDKGEVKHMDKAAKTTKDKADAQLSQFRVTLVKVGATPPQRPDVAKAPEKEGKAASEISDATAVVKENVDKIAVEANELGDVKLHDEK
jgi:hypothetical protein